MYGCSILNNGGDGSNENNGWNGERGVYYARIYSME